MIKLVQEITDLVQNGLPITYKRKPGEINQRLINEYFSNNKEMIDDLDHIFNTESNISQIWDEHLEALLKMITPHEQHFLNMNTELAMQNMKMDSPKKEVVEKEEWEITLKQVWKFIMQIAKDVEEWAENPMKGYIKLKKIESSLKNALWLIKDLAYDDFENWPKDDLPFGYTGHITNKLYAKYDQDEEYKELKTNLKSREDLLKEAINQNVKGNSMNDSDWCVVEVPEYSYKASLVVKKGVKKK